MAKRFVSTNLGREPWFRKLKPKLKCAVRYLYDECDQAGVWVIDVETMNYFVAPDDGEITLTLLFEQLNSDRDPEEEKRIEMFGKDKIFIPGFIEFQYGRLSELSPAHKPIFSLLKRYRLLDRVLGRVSSTLQEKEKEMDKEEEEEITEKGSGEKPKADRKPNLKGETDLQPELKKDYEILVIQVKEAADTKTRKTMLAQFISEKKPRFIEPFTDLWNVSVQAYKLSQVETISESRIKKFKNRIREPAFDFLKILQEIRQSDYLQGKTNGWKVDWDWIFENDDNYVKIIEGRYKNTSN